MLDLRKRNRSPAHTLDDLERMHVSSSSAFLGQKGAPEEDESSVLEGGYFGVAGSDAFRAYFAHCQPGPGNSEPRRLTE